MMWSCFWWASGAADCVEYGKSRLPSVFLSRRHRQTKKNCMSASVVAAQGVVEFVFLHGSWSATTMTRFILHLYQRDYDLLITTLTSSIFHLYQRDPNLLVAILICVPSFTFYRCDSGLLFTILTSSIFRIYKCDSDLITTFTVSIFHCYQRDPDLLIITHSDLLIITLTKCLSFTFTNVILIL